MRKKMLMFVFVLMLMYSVIAIGYSTWIITTESNITPNFSGQAEITLGNYDTQTSVYDGKKIIDEYQEDNSDVKLPEELQPIIFSNYKEDFIYQSIDSDGNILETLTETPRNAGEYKITIEPKDEAINYEKIEINYTIKPRLIELVYGYNDSVDYYSNEMTSDIRKVYDGKQTYPLVKVKNLQEDEEGNIDVCDLEYEWGINEENSITRLSNVKDYSEEAYVGKIISKSNANYTFISDDEEIDNTKLEFTFKIEKRIIDIKWSDQVNFVYDGEIKNLQAEATNLVENDNVEIVLAGEQSNANAMYNSTINQQSYLLSGKNKYYTTAVNLTGDDSHNYALPDADLCAKEYIISQALLLVNANDKDIIYGDIASNNGVSYNGFVNADDELIVPSLLNITYNYTYDTSVKELRKVGEYEIIPNIETEYTNYYIVSSNGKLTVERKELMISLTSNILTYNGNVQMPQFVFDGFVYNETIDDIIEEISISQEIKLAKTYNDVIISIDENSNYKFNEFIFDVTVNPKPIDITWSIPTLIYNGQVQYLKTEYVALNGVIENDEIGLSVSGSGKDASYQHQGSATITNTNYVFRDTNTAITTTLFTINPKDITYNWNVDTYIYNGGHQSPYVSFVGVIGEDTIDLEYQYSYNDNIVLETINYGNYEAKAISFTNTNYNVLDKENAVQAYTIEKKEVYATLENNEAPWTGSEIIPIVSITNTISSNPCEYTLTYSINGTTVSSMIEIGVYIVTVNITDENYKLVDEQYMYHTFEITKAIPEYETITGLTGVVGNKLSSIDLANYEGFSWMNPDQIITGSGETVFLAKYTPSDTIHYEIVENIEIIVYVTKMKVTVSVEDKEVIYNGKANTITPVIKDENGNILSANDYANLLTITTYYGDSSNTTGYINANVNGISDVYITVAVKDSLCLINSNGNDVERITLTAQLIVKPITLDITWDQITYIYTGNMYTPTITIDKSKVISGDSVNYKLTGGSNGHILDIGKYTFTATSTNSNYVFNNNTATIEVVSNEITYTWNVGTYTYNKSHQAPNIVVSDESIKGTVQYQITDVNGNVVSNSINVGTYTIKVIGWSNTTYVLVPEAGSSNSISYTIGKATPTFGSNIVLQSIYLNDSVSSSDLIITNNGSPSTAGSFDLITDLNTISIIPSTYNNTNRQTSVALKYTFNPTDSKNYKSVEVSTNLYINVVAYSDQTKTFYSYLEKALEATTSGNVYVIPGSNPTITSNSTVGTNVILTLPYAFTYNNGTVTIEWNDRHGENKVFADSTIELVNTYCKLTVTIAEGVTLTVNGTLNIGGVLGTKGQGLSAHTSGNYAQIMMDSKSKIISNGTIWSQGYIKETSLNNQSSVMVNSGDIYAPFVIYDFRGGSSTGGVYKGDGGPISPFEQYDMPNIQSSITLVYGTRYIGLVSLHTGETSILTVTIAESYNTSEVTVIGTGGILVPEYGATVKVKYSSYYEEGKPLTVDDDINGTTVVDIYGGASFGAMTLKVEAEVSGIGASFVEDLVNTTVNTQDVLFPVNWKYTLNLHDGNYTLGNKLKFLPGSTLYVSPTATLNITSEVIFYSQLDSIFNDTNPIGYNYPTDKEGAKLIVDGTANISGSFGGYIETNSITGRLIITTSTLSISSKQGYGSRDGTSVTFHVLQTITESTRADIYRDNSVTEKEQLSTGIYYSTGSAWEAHNSNINITYEHVFVDCEEVSEITNSNATTIAPTGSMELKDPVMDASYGLVFDGWYLTSDCSGNRVTVLNGLDYSSDITLYAKWVEGEKYTLTYVYYTGSDVLLSNATSNTKVYEYLAGSTQKVITLPSTKEGYTFTHWGTDSGRTTDVGETYVVGAGIEMTSDITLYAKYNIINYTVTYDANGGSVSKTTEKVAYKGSVSMPTPTRDGYSFQGWSESSTATSGKTGTLSNIKKDTALYATWKQNSSGCIAAGTLITLADGTHKKVEDLTGDELLLVFNHETGKYDYANIIFTDNDGWKEYRILNLVFSDGTIVKVIYSHGFFDLDTNEYVYIDYDNVSQYINHRFHKGTFDGTNYNGEIVTLVDAYETVEYTGCYSPVTVYHLNYYTNDLLSMPAGIEGLFNIFEYDENMKYDGQLKQQDIEKYGLYTYEDFKDYLPEEIYNLFPAPYFKVSVGKGYITFEEILGLIDRYLDTMLKQNNIS